jgi:N-acetylglucosaminylphosphatidylinositol deacetylase
MSPAPLYCGADCSAFFLACYSADVGEWSGKGEFACSFGGFVCVVSGLMVGNNYGIGETRKKELGGACQVLGIDRQERCVVLDRKYGSLCASYWRLTSRELQDNPQLWWDTDLVENVIEEYVKRWKIDAIITFDDGGVSGHINHRAVAAGVRYLLPKFPSFYTPF